MAMNPFLLTPRERLEDWKKFRDSLTTMSEDDALQAVATYWAQAPLSRFTYDPEDPSDWPSIWEMVSDGDWCRCTVAIGMEATLRLAGWSPERMKIIYMRDYNISDQFMIVKIDENKILNYGHGIITEYPETDHTVMAIWQFEKREYRAAAR